MNKNLLSVVPTEHLWNWVIFHPAWTNPKYGVPCQKLLCWLAAKHLPSTKASSKAILNFGAGSLDTQTDTYTMLSPKELK